MEMLHLPLRLRLLLLQRRQSWPLSPVLPAT